MTLSLTAVVATALGSWAISRRFSLMMLFIAMAWGAAVHGVIHVTLPPTVAARLEAREAKQEAVRKQFLCERRSLAALQRDEHNRFDEIQRACPGTPSSRDAYGE